MIRINEIKMPLGATEDEVKIATAKVLKTNDKWYGMTYLEDKETVTAAINEMVEKGIYPEKLWK